MTLQPPHWAAPPARLTLAQDEVHVWRASLALPAWQLRHLWQILSPEERSRAERFRFAQHRDNHIAARGLLRLILSRYLSLDPAQLRFSYGAWGKPALTAETDGDRLRFNLSHSGELALYAIAEGREVGVDLELMRADFTEAAVAQRTFSPREFAALSALPASEWTRGFFNCWTRKEAYIKARGEGLSLPLDQFDVSLAPAEPARLLRVLSDERETRRWQLKELFPGPAYAGALAAEGSDWQLRCWQWPMPHPERDDQQKLSVHRPDQLNAGQAGN
ncbi:MAG TPA: 4'-phosphopantetheinyl transferase superfamily protein [Blastocatellia bacterium]|nr:4'-phosphopantetheinyl transferase superfamily protein [Blastocatellia bacterium]